MTRIASVPRALAVAVGVLALALFAATALASSPFDSATGAPVLAPVDDPLSVQAGNQLEVMGPSVEVVECAPGVAKLPAGITPSRGLGFAQTHPGFQVLSDGHCVMDVTIRGSVIKPESAE
jgi:hypothetical protein